MKNIILMSAICVQLVWCYDLPGDTRGVGAFAYQDSDGNRYGGTYGLKDGQLVETNGNFPPNFRVNTYQDLNNFIPEYFKNLDYLLQDGRRIMEFTPIRPFKPFRPFRPFPPFNPLKPLESSTRRAFYSNLEGQRLAYNAAQKAFDLTSNQAGYIPNFNFRFPYNDFSHLGVFSDVPSPFPAMPNFDNGFSAFAGAAARPGYIHQVASINPANPEMPNVDKVNRFADPQPDSGFRAVSSSSYSATSNVDGKVTNQRGAETIVNDNGKITKYKVGN